jgi:hypothetical protein
MEKTPKKGGAEADGAVNWPEEKKKKKKVDVSHPRTAHLPPQQNRHAYVDIFR